ncbi:MAG: hypothetical protein AAGC96_03660 [Pseudomonadota bacterium]
MRLLKLLIPLPLLAVMGFWASALPVGVKWDGTNARITCSQGIFGNKEWQCRQTVLRICGPDGRITDVKSRKRPAMYDESDFSKSFYVTTWIYQLENCTPGRRSLF